MRPVAELNQEFRDGKPFPNIVLDQFEQPEKLFRAVQQIPPFDHPGWKQNQKGKKGFANVLSLGGDIADLFDQYTSTEFVGWLSELSGIPNLIADREFRGAGIHAIPRGGSLGVHVDFNQVSDDLYRRLNCFLFLNQFWKREWRGQLELWDAPKGDIVRSIEPKFNRFVAFESSEHSWHGHPAPLECPEDRCRFSFAFYYYTREKPAAFVEKHSTIYVPKEGKDAHRKAG